VGNFVPGLSKFNFFGLHPNGRDALIVAGGQGYIVDPETKQLRETLGGTIVNAFPHPTRSALVLNHQNLRFEAIAADGRLWMTRRISWDGMRLVQQQGKLLIGEAWRPDSTWHPFEVDLENGQVLGGSYSEPQMPPVSKKNPAVIKKWKVAALTLITWPAAIWFVAQDPRSRPLGLWITIGSIPLFTAILMELRAHWDRLSKDPAYVDKGSPVGNRIAVVLAAVIICLLLFGIYSAFRQQNLH
jgi:hypothetical protein